MIIIIIVVIAIIMSFLSIHNLIYLPAQLLQQVKHLKFL